MSRPTKSTISRAPPCPCTTNSIRCRQPRPRLLEHPLGLRGQRDRSVEGASWRKDGNLGAAGLSSTGPARPGSGQPMIALPPLGPRRIALLDPGDFTPPYDVALARGLIAQGCEPTLIGQAGNRNAIPAAFRREHFYGRLVHPL